MKTYSNPFSQPYSNRNTRSYEGYFTVYTNKPLSLDFDVHYAYSSDNEGGVYGPAGKNDHFIMECCTEGHGMLTLNGKEYHIKKGDCYVVYPYVLMSSCTLEDSSASYAWFGFKGLRAEFYLRKLGVTPDQPFLNSDAFDFISHTIMNMSRDFQEENLSNQLFQTAQVNLIFSKLISLSESSKIESKLSEYVKKATRYIEEHYMDEISISTLAMIIGLDRSYFFDIFKQETGFSPQEYLIHYRIRQACAMLITNPKMTVTDIAGEVGYHSTNFMRMFKRIMGITPTEYRSMYSKQQICP